MSKAQRVKRDVVESPQPAGAERVEVRENEAQVDAPVESHPYPVEIDGLGVVLPKPKPAGQA